MLEKIISGGQTGADIGGLIAAKKNGLAHGGTAPPNWLTEDGPNFDLKKVYGLSEYILEDNYPERAFPMPEGSRIRLGYVDRTVINVKDANATIRFASNFQSAGEKCTLRAIKKHNKPYFDVDYNEDTIQRAEEMAKWIEEKDIKVLNVAGNRETTAPGIEKFVVRFLTEAISILRQRFYHP